MIFLLASLSLLASDVTSTATTPTVEVSTEAAAAASAAVTYFEHIGTHAELIGACSAFIPFNALYSHGDTVLELPEFAEMREGLEPELRELLAKSFLQGRDNPIESDLTSERCDTLLAASTEIMATNLAAMRFEVETAEKAAAAAPTEVTATEATPATETTPTPQSPPASDAPQH